MDETTDGALTLESAAEALLDVSDSYEEPTDEVQEEADEAEPVEAEDAETEESNEEDAETDDSDDESDATPEEGSHEPDARLAERERELTADYTRKTQEVAETRKRAEAALAEAAERRDSYAQRLADVEAVLAANAPAEPDWVALRQSDPAEFAAQWAEHQQRNEQMQAVRAERERVQAEQAEEQQRSYAERLATESALLIEAIPEWKDPEKAGAEKKQIMDYAMKHFGATEEELGQIADHRWIVLLRKAAKYDELTTKGAEQIAAKKVDAPKVLAPGHRDTAPKDGKQTQIEALRKRLQKSGSVRDAARLFEEID